MFRLRSLEVENFGPYKGKQRVAFPDEDGVIMFYGENMRGKTTLLNAIRFAFFGKFVGRGSKAIPLSKVGNWEAAAVGTYGFEVKLEMMYEGVKYRLTRSCEPRVGVAAPSEDDDFVVNYYLEKDGVILGTSDGARELERILPEQISRFFLFDGELLQEYEELLLDESTAGDNIARAIERVLGMPILTNARATLAATKEAAQKEQASAAQGDQRTRQFGVMLSELLAQSQVMTEDLARLESDLADVRGQRALLEEQMRKNERIRAILDRKEFLEGELADLTEKVAADGDALRASMSAAWSVVLRDKMKDTLVRVRERHANLRDAVLRRSVLKDLADKHIETCPTCGQGVAEDALVHLRGLIAESDSDSDGRDLDQEMSEVARQMGALELQIDTASPKTLQLLIDNLEDTRRSIHTKRGEIKDLNNQLSGVDEEGLRKVRHDYEAAIRETQVVEEGIKATRDRLAENETQRESLQSKLAKQAGTSVVAAQDYVRMNSDLHDLFDQAIAHYRDRLRHRVQADATKHFLSLTTEEEYVGLRINDSYGLSIVHKDGSDIPLRSAGAEHIVAFALIAALQNNAPLRGPIVMDSAFVRLDGGHKDSIMKALPTFASQVIMLVYEDEMSPARARKALTGHMKAEFKLKRISSRHTELTQQVDA
ncbi:AAA family ATPase [Devosia sp. LjRoot16]|uniref:AAA family ATPase n=1 Tax=Devosia sp. LjRoot16 TaxID=3342271 RepID=UPI003ED03A50